MIAIAFGGNHSNSNQLILEAASTLGNDLYNPKHSSICITEPLGQAKNNYFNSVLVADKLKVELSDFWISCQALEKQFGRDRNNEVTWGDRSIDIDILFSDNAVVVVEGLILPHPQLHRRSFVLEPLRELLPSWKHPLLGQTVDEMIKNLF